MQHQKTVRILVIIQLCIAFMMLAWYVCYPFMGELYYWRSRLFLVHNVTGDTYLLDYVKDEEKIPSSVRLEANRKLFSELPGFEQDEIMDDLRHYQLKLKKSLKQKLASSLDIFLHHLPPFKEAWLVFSFIVCFALLYRIQGAALVVWALPFLAICYLLASRGYPSGMPADAHLYPQEGSLDHFSKETLGETWKAYLAHNWGGEFYFNQARLKALRSHPGYNSAYNFKHKEPFILLILYFAWNLFFAYTCYKNSERKRCKNQLTTVFIQL